MAPTLAGGADHPSWFTAAATLVSYGLVLAVLTAVLFGVPYLLFAGLGP